jgi:hypothetical protein
MSTNNNLLPNPPQPGPYDYGGTPYANAAGRAIASNNAQINRNQALMGGKIKRRSLKKKKRRSLKKKNRKSLKKRRSSKRRRFNKRGVLLLITSELLNRHIQAHRVQVKMRVPLSY